MTTSPPAPGPHLTALPISTSKPGSAEVFSSTSTPVLTWGQEVPEGAELQPEAAQCLCAHTGQAGVIPLAALSTGKVKAPCRTVPGGPHAASAAVPGTPGGSSGCLAPLPLRSQGAGPRAQPDLANPPAFPPEPLQALGFPFSGPLN